MSDPTVTALGRLIETELQHKFWWTTRDDLAERRESVLSLMEKRFGACFSRDLIRQVSTIQFDLLLTVKD
jgi:hypothetical protein